MGVSTFDDWPPEATRLPRVGGMVNPSFEAIVALLPKDFKKGMENWTGEVHEHISDTNFGLLLHDMIEQRECVVYATDLDGDRLTDLMADAETK